MIPRDLFDHAFGLFGPEGLSEFILDWYVLIRKLILDGGDTIEFDSASIRTSREGVMLRAYFAGMRDADLRRIRLDALSRIMATDPIIPQFVTDAGVEGEVHRWKVDLASVPDRWRQN